jgi:hypothetical protein
MNPRFLADASLNHSVLTMLHRREPLLDFLGAHAAGLRGLPDPEVLRVAPDAGRLLVTPDKATMPAHFADFIAARESPGVLPVPRHLNVREVAENLLLVWAASEAEEWVNRISYLPI